VSKGAFYHHFASKQRLFLGILSRWLEGLDAQMLVIRTGGGSIPDRLLLMADMMRYVFQQAGDQLPMFLEFWGQAQRDPEIWEATIAPYRRYRTYFAQMIQSGIDEGSFRPVDPDLAAKHLVSLAVGILLQGLLDPEGDDWGQVSRSGIEMFLQSLIPGSGDPPRDGEHGESR